MIIKLLNRVLQVKNIFFVYILIYTLSIAQNPTITSARYIAEITGNYALVTALCLSAALCALAGIVLPFNPVRFWMLCLPFLGYCFIIAYVILHANDPKAYATVATFVMFIMLAVCITWEDLNAPDK